MSDLKSKILELAQSGKSASDILASLREAQKNERAALAADADKAKMENRERTFTSMEDARQFASEQVRHLLPGSCFSIIARRTDNGDVIVTATDGHSKGTKESLHVNASGERMTGEDGARACLNVKARGTNK